MSVSVGANKDALVWSAQKFEVQQYQGIAARSSGYFIIAEHGSVYRWIPDEYTDLDDED